MTLDPCFDTVVFGSSYKNLINMYEPVLGSIMVYTFTCIAKHIL